MDNSTWLPPKAAEMREMADPTFEIGEADPYNSDKSYFQTGSKVVISSPVSSYPPSSSTGFRILLTFFL